MTTTEIAIPPVQFVLLVEGEHYDGGDTMLGVFATLDAAKAEAESMLDPLWGHGDEIKIETWRGFMHFDTRNRRISEREDVPGFYHPKTLTTPTRRCLGRTYTRKQGPSRTVRAWVGDWQLTMITEPAPMTTTDKPKTDNRDPSLVYISASQIKKWRECPRKWAYRYVDKREEPRSPKAQFGTDVHTHLETWSTTGKAPPSTPQGEAAKALIGFAPNPRTAIKLPEGETIPQDNPSSTLSLCEPLFELTHKHDPSIPVGVVLLGFIDVLRPPDAAPMCTVQDYKSTGSMRYALTEAALPLDPQALLYAKVAICHYGLAFGARVRLWWPYVEVSNPKTGPRRVTGKRMVCAALSFEQPEIAAAWAELIATVEAIAHARKTLERAEDATADTGGCDNFGGCPHLDVCPISSIDRMASAIGNAKGRPTGPKPESAKLLTLNTGGGTSDLSPEHTESVPMASATLDRIRAMKNKNKSAAKAPDEVTPAAAAPPAAAAEPATVDAKATAKPASGGAYTRCEVEGCRKKATATGRCAGHAADAAEGEGEGEPVAAAPAAAAATEPAAEEATPPAAAEPAAAPAKAKSKAKAAKPKTEIGINPADAETLGHGRLTALIDCAPTKVEGSPEVHNFGDIVRDAADEVRGPRAHWSHPENGEHFVDLRALLTMATEKRLRNKEGLLLVDTSSTDQSVALDAVHACASVVVRGLR